MALVGGLVAALVGVGALVYATRLGKPWIGLVLAGAAGWLAAQVGKELTAILVAAAVSHGRPLSVGAAALSPAVWWFPFFGAALPAVWEELGKYLPLRWAAVALRERALVLGLGAGALEAVYVGALTAGGLLGGVGAVQVAAGAWERFWAVVAHAGLGTLDGAAAYLRRPAWLGCAMALHFAADLLAGRYQQLRAQGAHGQLPVLVASEVVAALLALAAIGLGRRAWNSARA